MDNSNYCIFTGVVSEINEIIKTDVIKPVIKLDLYTKETKEWNSSIRVVFVENEDARKIKGISKGDIIFVFGKMSYSDDFGNYIYADSFVMLQKNKINASQLSCRVAYFEYYINPNIIQLSGNICNINKNKINLMIERFTNIRGEIVEHDNIPIELETTENIFQNGDNIRFIGKIKDNKIIGNAVLVKRNNKINIPIINEK